MGRRCTICHHPKREAIEKALVDTGTGYRTVAERFGISNSALFRHRKRHLPERLQKALAAKPPPLPPPKPDTPLTEQEERQALDVVAQLRAINAACLEVLKTARAARDHPILLRAVDRVLRQLDFSARLTGEMQDGKVQVAIGAGSQVVVLIPDNARGDGSPHRAESGIVDLEPAYLTDGEGYDDGT